jgi:hypothetical protein
VVDRYLPGLIILVALFAIAVPGYWVFRKFLDRWADHATSAPRQFPQPQGPQDEDELDVR